MQREEKIQILEQFSNESYLYQFGNGKETLHFPEAVKSQLLEALGPKIQEKDGTTPGGIQFNIITTKMFCERALKTLLQETGNKLPESLKLPEDFEQVKAEFIKQQREEFETGIKVGHISENSETLEHTKEDKLNYQSGSFEEKWKATFGYEKNFTPRADRPPQIKMFNQAYLPLNPDTLEQYPQLLDFILHGTFHKGYPFTEKKLLVYEMMNNADGFKEKLLDYEVLVIPTEGGYSQEISERILKYSGAQEEGGRYLITENTPEVHKEKHLRKYTGNTIRFTPFLDKASALRYLSKQLGNVHNQIQRIATISTALGQRRSFPDTEEVNTLLEEALQYFSYYRSKADQAIVTACERALNNHNISNRNQILSSMISKLPALKKEAEKKLETMTKHFEAFKDNQLF